MMNNRVKELLLVIIITAFVVRLVPINLPFFTDNEARFAYRGYTLSKYGTDELGRKFPLIFNSLTDYQLPVTSYLAAVGITFFGKNDLGARIPFILLSVITILLIYKISELFYPSKEFKLLATLVASFSPALIFFSKYPNDVIVLNFCLILLFYLLTRKRLNFWGIGFMILFSNATSKIAWLVVLPFVVLTILFFQPDLPKKIKLGIFTTALILTVFVILLFLHVPQSQRSLFENNLLIFQDSSIKVALDNLRVQGLQAGWPSIIEKILFSKLHFIIVIFFHWLSFLNLSVLFAQLDKAGVAGYAAMGAFPKVIIIPFLLGLIYLIREEGRKFRRLIWFFLILTFPTAFTFPNFNPDIIILLVPFASFLVAIGLINIKRNLRYLILTIAFIEVLLNLIYLSPEIRNANISRPGWIKPIMVEAYEFSSKNQVAISDDMVSEIAAFLQWYTPIGVNAAYQVIDYPYKFNQHQLGNIKILGADATFYKCGQDFPEIIASRRDLYKVTGFLNKPSSEIVQKTYRDDLGNEVAYLFKPIICIH